MQFAAKIGETHGRELKYPAPPCRTLRVMPDFRQWPIDGESRLLNLAAEARTFSVPLEVRLWQVLPESRVR